MCTENKTLAELMVSRGLFFPSTEEAFTEIEKDLGEGVPPDFENPREILSRKLMSLQSEIDKLKK